MEPSSPSCFNNSFIWPSGLSFDSNCYWHFWSQLGTLFSFVTNCKPPYTWSTCSTACRDSACFFQGSEAWDELQNHRLQAHRNSPSPLHQVRRTLVATKINRKQQLMGSMGWGSCSLFWMESLPKVQTVTWLKCSPYFLGNMPICNHICTQCRASHTNNGPIFRYSSACLRRKFGVVIKYRVR